ncbi:hypothetical protein [Paenibacillus oryzisoli]|uniref:Uncharacterized protein n=1 Tax=Paenibacillus oryzisoli TaxID=1850517 RepID=A0A198A8E8_9BACL|nr:hypothetical protein [Paenibacillus oryzisoli]OAS17380.1 hypothetical protein A8708_21645 [Paenibacillus oryzisoli]
MRAALGESAGDAQVAGRSAVAKRWPRAEGAWIERGAASARIGLGVKIHELEVDPRAFWGLYME